MHYREPLGVDIFKDFDGFREAKWNQVGIKLDFNIGKISKSAFLTKLRFPIGRAMIGRVAHVEVGRKIDQQSIKKQSKINLNLGRPHGIDFSSIFIDFGSQNRAKLGRKIDKKIDAKMPSQVEIDFL